MGRIVAACLAVLFAIFEFGSCINCYRCISLDDKDCEDPFTTGNPLYENVMDCMTQESVYYNQKLMYSILPREVLGSVPGAPRYCHKIIMQTGTVIRTCLDGNPNDMNHTCRTMEKSSKTSTSDKVIKYCGVCDKEYCNAAASITFSLPLAIAILFGSYLLYKH